ncbi:MAG: D-aminoacyl-tRNA deacylase [Tepidisphaeraceae bacterium]
MIAVVQRVTSASVIVADRVAGKINHGIVALVAVERGDTEADATWLAERIVSLRIFRDGEKHFELDVKQANGSILLVSNFTLAAETDRGRRPSLDGAADPESAKALFEQLVTHVRNLDVPVATGEFAADMLVHIDNDGPATFIVSSRRSRGHT